MRHRVDHRKLGRTASHRKAMLANMVTSLFDKERITTTEPKAKEARRLADKLITRAKKGYAAYQEHHSHVEAGKEAEALQTKADALAHWRQAGRVIRKKAVLKKLFDSLAPLFMDRNGGYTRILRVGTRPGDGATTVLLELVGTEITSAPMVKKPKKAAEASDGNDKDKAKEDKKAKAKEKVEAKADKKAKKAKAEESAEDKSKDKDTEG